MDVESLDALEKGRSHVIARPRLTSVLDEATARILLLVAPAGYGKTLLVREWLAERRYGWYRGNQSTADVAALAVGFAKAAAEIVPGAGERMANRLRTAPGTPKRDVEPLAELLAEDLPSGPPTPGSSSTTTTLPATPSHRRRLSSSSRPSARFGCS